MTNENPRGLPVAGDEFSPDAVFDADSNWNASRERLEAQLLLFAERLLDHSEAAAITIKGVWFEVSINHSPVIGAKQ